jgi:hypothetical protein
MTERAPRRRASKRSLRAWAWITGGLAFLTPLGALAAAPAPPSDVAQGRPERPVLVIRKITKRVVVHERPAEAPVTYVSAPSTSTSAPAAPAVAAPAAPPPPPPAPPATTTGGS